MRNLKFKVKPITADFIKKYSENGSISINNWKELFQKNSNRFIPPLEPQKRKLTHIWVNNKLWYGKSRIDVSSDVKIFGKTHKLIKKNRQAKGVILTDVDNGSSKNLEDIMRYKNSISFCNNGKSIFIPELNKEFLNRDNGTEISKINAIALINNLPKIEFYLNQPITHNLLELFSDIFDEFDNILPPLLYEICLTMT